MKLKLIIVLLLLSFSLQAQTFEINLKFQSTTLMEYERSKKEKIFSPSIPIPFWEPNLGITFYPLEGAGIEIKAGIVLMPFDYFFGWEYSFLGKYYLAPWFYLTGGFLIHLNDGGGSNSSGSSGANLNMYGLGAGFKVSKLISFDLIFFDLKDQYIRSHRDLNNPESQAFIYDLNWLIKFNIGFNWQL